MPPPRRAPPLLLLLAAAAMLPACAGNLGNADALLKRTAADLLDLSFLDASRSASQATGHDAVLQMRRSLRASVIQAHERAGRMLADNPLPEEGDPPPEEDTAPPPDTAMAEEEGLIPEGNDCFANLPCAQEIIDAVNNATMLADITNASDCPVQADDVAACYYVRARGAMRRARG